MGGDVACMPPPARHLVPKCISVITARLFNNNNSPSQPLPFTRYACLLRHFGRSKNLLQGKLLHALIKKEGHSQNVFLANLLVQMYGRCGALDAALDVFDSICEKNQFSWGIMIEAGNKTHKGWSSVQLFHQMKSECVFPDNVGLLSIVSAHSILGHVCEGKRLHACIVAMGLSSDVILGTGLISMYASFGSPQDSHNVFDNMHDRNVVTWNAIISAYAHLGCLKAIQIFQQMQLECMLPSRTSFIAVLNAFGEQGNIAEGKWIHAHIAASRLDSDVVMGSALIHLYGKCRSSKDACAVFKSLSSSNLICWTAMMVAFSKCSQMKEALHLLHQMDVEGMAADDVTYIGLVDGCANNASLMDGKHIHTRVVSVALESNVVANALVIMYGKCGIVDYAWKTFSRMKKRDVTSWNSIISAFALNGDGTRAVELCHQMQVAGMVPSMATFSSVLSACSRAGLVHEGLHLFRKMSSDYGIVPSAEHYNCLIDLLGRMGRLDEAEELIKKLPAEPNVTGWTMLLGSSSMYSDRERAHHAAGCAFELNSESPAPYVLLSNVHCTTE